MYSFEVGVLMYKYYINDLPYAFNDYFTKRSDIHDYKTRYVNDLNLTNKTNKQNKTKQKLFRPFCSNDWSHSLEFYEKKIINSKTVEQFRNQYKKTLISNYE